MSFCTKLNSSEEQIVSPPDTKLASIPVQSGDCLISLIKSNVFQSDWFLLPVGPSL